MGKRRGAAGLRAAGAVAVAGATLLGARPARGLRWRSFTTQEGARGGPRPGLGVASLPEKKPYLGGEGRRGASD